MTPSKALLRNAELTYAVTREAERFGFSGQVSADYRVAHERSRQVAEGRSEGKAHGLGDPTGHPTMGEALQETFHGLEGHMINL